MPVKIRLMRIGAKKRPFYRVVAVDERKKRTGKYLELLGTYNPLINPHEIILKKERIDYWLGQGAVPSVGYLRIIHQAPQRLPRKPRKAVEEKAPEMPKEEVKIQEGADLENTTQPEETAPGTESKATENEKPPAEEAVEEQPQT
ncbi:MAG: 30S ribosomal protein S16 [Armatimonadetes bacterium]|nr:MAG: 30S ribosomal protein S16 [Armatimonadota bacterium]